jgi:predicted SAM-dependent methyltransferase
MSLSFKQTVGSWIQGMTGLNDRAIHVLRFEIATAGRRFINIFSVFYHLKVWKLRKLSGISLNIGSGGRGLADWINFDVRYHGDTYLAMDCRRRLPIGDGSVSRILAEHVVEHMEFRSEFPKFLSECFRILEPGGMVRIIVPDAERFVKAYVRGSREEWLSLNWDPAALPSDIYTPMHVLNHVFHQSGEHLFGYDFATLKLQLEKAGFQDIEKCEFRKSRDPLLAIDQENHAPYSLYVEALRP